MVRIIWIITFLLLSISSSRAALVTESVSFNVKTSSIGTSIGSQGFNLDVVSLNPFDSSLGQLDSVNVSIFANLLITGTTGLNYFSTPIGVNVPVPYIISPTAQIRIYGQNDYFETTSIDRLYSSSALGGTGHPIVPIAGQLNSRFTIDEITAAGGKPLPGTGGLGGVPLSVPLVSGAHSDFLDTGITSDLLLISLQLSFRSSAFAVIRTLTKLEAMFTGQTTVEYHYTPLTEPLPAVPLPAAIYLFGAALVGLFGFHHRKQSGLSSSTVG